MNAEFRFFKTTALSTENPEIFRVQSNFKLIRPVFPPCAGGGYRVQLYRARSGVAEPEAADGATVALGPAWQTQSGVC